MIIDSSDNDNNTILLLVPIAPQPQSLSNEFAKFKYYIGITAAARNNFILPPRQEKFRNKIDVKEYFTRLLLGSSQSY